MKHVYAFLIKFVMIVVILGILLSLLTDVTFENILIISAVVAVLAYIIGDLITRPKTNNIIATIVVAGITLLVLVIFNYWPAFRSIGFFDGLISAIVVGVGDWICQKYVNAKILPDKKTT